MPNPPREQSIANLIAIANRRRGRTHCARGHNNWYIGKDGRRRCRTCKNENNVSKLVDPRGPYGLRSSEIQVLELVAEGLSVTQIASKLHYHKTTIVDKRRRIVKKMGTRNIMHSVTKALRERIIE